MASSREIENGIRKLINYILDHLKKVLKLNMDRII